MTLEGMIRNAAGASAVKSVTADDYPAAKAKLLGLLAEGSTLLWMRAA